MAKVQTMATSTTTNPPMSKQPASKVTPTQPKPERTGAGGPNDKTGTSQPTDKLQEVMANYKSATDYVRSSYWKDWDDFWRLYHNQRVPALQSYFGMADTFDPMTFQQVELILANLYAEKPRFVYEPTMEEQYSETKVLNALADYYWECNNMTLTVLVWGREILVVGTGAIWASWDGDKPKFRHVPIRDCFFDPTAPQPSDIRYGGYRRLAMVADLKKEQVWDAKAEKMVPKYKNIDEAKMWTNSKQDQTDKELKDMYHGSTLSKEAMTGQAEIIYYATKDEIIEVMNRSQIVYQVTNPYQKAAETKHVIKQDTYEMTQVGPPDPMTGMPVPVTSQQTTEEMIEVQVPAIEPFIPVIIQRCYVDGSLLYGVGEVENIAYQQELLNDTENQHTDNLSLNLDEVKLYDPQYKDVIPQVVNGAGVMIPIPPGGMAPMPKQDMTGAAAAEIARLKQGMRDTTGSDISGFLHGMTNARMTQVEINAAIQQAGKRFGVKTQMLENEGFRQLASIIYKFVQIFVTTEQVVRIAGPNGTEFVKYSPDLYWGPYEPKVILESAMKAQQQQDSQQAINMMAIFRGDPLVNQEELYKYTMRHGFDLDDDEAKELLTPATNGMAGATATPDAQGAPQPGQQPGMPPGAPGQAGPMALGPGHGANNAGMPTPAPNARALMTAREDMMDKMGSR